VPHFPGVGDEIRCQVPPLAYLLSHVWILPAGASPTFSPAFVARGRRWLTMHGLRPRAPEASRQNVAEVGESPRSWRQGPQIRSCPASQEKVGEKVGLAPRPEGVEIDGAAGTGQGSADGAQSDGVDPLRAVGKAGELIGDCAVDRQRQ
jgi:hypothetical protein